MYQVREKETGGDISNQAELRVSYVNAAVFPVAVDDTLIVKFNPDGTFVYYPEANYNGPDSFVYMITDAANRTSTATVTIDVDCASSQTSDGGDTLGSMGILIMMLMTMLTGLYFVRQEEKGNES